MDNHKKYYTAADYSRYHSGEMSAAEMHDLEKAALQDPFVQDALDGYVHTKTGEADVALLRKRLASANKEDKVVVVSYPFKNYWKIAAVLIVGATISFLVYNNNQNEKTQQLAEVTTPAVDNLDSQLTKDIATANENSIEGNMNDATTNNGDNSVSSNNTQVAAAVKNVGRDVVEKKAIEKIGKNYKVDGTVVTDDGLALTNAKIISDDKQVLAQTDDQGKFEFESKNATASTTIITEGYQERKKTLDANQSSTVVMKEQAKAFSTQESTAKKALRFVPPASENTIAVPANGWDSFNAYLKEKTPVVYNVAGIKQTGNVVLSFEVDKLGIPEKISVKKSECRDCNLAAIQLLKDGPKWTGKTGIVNEISIKF
jgi:hypothetical protein